MYDIAIQPCISIALFIQLKANHGKQKSYSLYINNVTDYRFLVMLRSYGGCIVLVLVFP